MPCDWNEGKVDWKYSSANKAGIWLIQSAPWATCQSLDHFSLLVFLFTKQSWTSSENSLSRSSLQTVNVHFLSKPTASIVFSNQLRHRKCGALALWPPSSLAGYDRQEVVLGVLVTMHQWALCRVGVDVLPLRPGERCRWSASPSSLFSLSSLSLPAAFLPPAPPPSPGLCLRNTRQIVSTWQLYQTTTKKKRSPSWNDNNLEAAARREPCLWCDLTSNSKDDNLFFATSSSRCWTLFYKHLILNVWRV